MAKIVNKSAKRLDQMIGSPIRTLAELAKAEAECTRCPLYKHATRAVPGEGRTGARLMLVGEQPGDKEDLAGKPFVGPAGAILDRGLVDADIDRKTVFVTNWSSTSNLNSAASAGCTSGRMPMRSNAASGGSTTNARSCGRQRSSRSVRPRHAACLDA